MRDWNWWEYDSIQGQMFLLHHVTRWTNQKKLDQSNLFTTVSTQSDSVSELTFAHHSPYQFLRFAYLRVNKVDVLQHGSWVSPVVNLIYFHVQFFSNNSGEPYGDNTGCQFQSWNWNCIYETSSCFSHDKCTVNLVGDIFQMEVNDGWISLTRSVWEEV